MGTINERIAQALEYAGYKKNAFAEIAGISPSAVTRLCNGTNQPSNQTKKDICNICKVRMEWLETGELPMESATTKGEKVARQLLNGTMSAVDRETLKARLDALTDEEFIAMAQIVQKLFG